MPPDPATLITGLAAALGLRLDAATADEVVITWTADERHLQPFGLIHGGVYCAVHETVASVGGSLWYAERGQVVGVNNTTDFLRSARPGDVLTSKGSPVHRGRLQQLWAMETYDAQHRLVARGQVRLQNLPA